MYYFLAGTKPDDLPAAGFSGAAKLTHCRHFNQRTSIGTTGAHRPGYLYGCTGYITLAA